MLPKTYYVAVSNGVRLILYTTLNGFPMNSVRICYIHEIIISISFILIFIVLHVLGKTSKKNMYQAINSAMDLILSKDPNSGNLL